MGLTKKEIKEMKKHIDGLTPKAQEVFNELPQEEIKPTIKQEEVFNELPQEDTEETVVYDESDSSSMEDDLQPDSYNVQEQTDFSKVVDLLLNDRYKRRKTILQTFQVAPLTTIDVMSIIYDIPFLKMWVRHFAEWRTSGDGGKGRKDIVDISKFHYASKQQDSEILNQLRAR